MKTAILAMVLSLMTMQAWADSSCTAQAADKKLAGAAKTSFLTKCQADVTTACTAQATEKKLAGAAKNSFMKKCTAGASG